MGFFDDEWDEDVAVADEIDPVMCPRCGHELEDEEGEGDLFTSVRLCDWCFDDD